MLSATKQAKGSTSSQPTATTKPDKQYTDGLGLSVTKSVEDTTLESLMARASVSEQDEDGTLDQTVHARQAITPGLQFRDKRMEVLYQVDYFAKYMPVVRRSIVIGTCLWALFVINDVYKNSIGLRRNFAATVSLRFGVIALALLALLSTYSQKFGRKAMTWLIATVITIFGAAQVISGAIELDTTDPTYSVAIVLISSTSSAFFRLPCIASIICNLTMYLVYVIVTGATGAYDTSSHFGTTCLWLFIGVLIFSLHAYDREWYIRSSYLAQRRLEYEEYKSQKVLLKMLPASVIEQLRSGAEFAHERHSNISVLFSHICEFDEHTSSMSPNEVIGLLNHIFSKFDSITDEFGVYKVETIGDVYLVSAGVPEPRDDHATALAHVAVSMMEALPEFQSVERLPVQLKIGINSGPVIAGVVGMKYPRFRLMGDTVNTSSRMSSTCKAGDIQVTPSCFQQLKPGEFIVQYRGEIEVKGKGRMKTYLIKDRAKKLPPKSVALDIVYDMDQNASSTQRQRTTPQPTDERLFIGTPRTPIPARSDPSPIQKSAAGVLVLANAAPKSANSASTQPTTLLLTTGQQQSQPLSPVSDSQVQVTDPPPYEPWSFPAIEISANSPRDETTSPTNADPSNTNATTKNKSSVRIHLPNHKSRTEPVVVKISPRNGHAQVASATGIQLENLSVVPGFGTGEEKPAAATSPAPQVLMNRTSSVPVPMSTSSPLTSSTLNVPSTNRAASMIELEPTPGSEVQPTGDFLSNEVIRISPGMASQSAPKERLAKKREAAAALAVVAVAHHKATTLPNGPSNIEEEENKPDSKDVLRITAKDVQVEGLFNSIEWTTLTDPKNPFSLSFKYNPELEKEFQQDFFRKFITPNRRGMLAFIVCMLLLGIYETLLNLPETTGESYNMQLTWIFRLVGLTVALAAYTFTYTHTDLYERYQQPILTCVWGLMGIVLISIFITLDTYFDVYAVTCVLLVLTMTSTFIGLQFIWVTCVTIFFLAWYLGGALIFYHSFPLVFFFLLASNVLAITASRSSEYYLRWDFIRHLKLQNEERRTRHFLDNMLPKSVIQEIKLDHSFIAHEFLKASVMFSDIVSFTQLASRISPEDVVAILNVMFSSQSRTEQEVNECELFAARSRDLGSDRVFVSFFLLAFDALTTKHNVYKVETIGDAYLACSGVVQRGPTQTEDLVKFALDLQTSTKFMHTPDGQPIIIRIGIHTGSVVAGVVGRKMPRYHLFGETVTIAEEMEQNGIPGSVVISSATFEESEGYFEVEKLEPIILHAKPAKNILPGDKSGVGAGLDHLPQPDVKTQVHRYRVIAHMGAMAPRREPSPDAGFSLDSPRAHQGRHSVVIQDLSQQASPSPSAPIARSSSSRPASAKRRGSVVGGSTGGGVDDFDRAPPPFVANILGKIAAKNFMDAQERVQERLERKQQAAKVTPAPGTTTTQTTTETPRGTVLISPRSGANGNGQTKMVTAPLI